MDLRGVAMSAVGNFGSTNCSKFVLNRFGCFVTNFGNRSVAQGIIAGQMNARLRVWEHFAAELSPAVNTLPKILIVPRSGLMNESVVTTEVFAFRSSFARHFVIFRSGEFFFSHPRGASQEVDSDWSH